jgi:hypothetical protein
MEMRLERYKQRSSDKVVNWSPQSVMETDLILLYAAKLVGLYLNLHTCGRVCGITEVEIK